MTRFIARRLPSLVLACVFAASAPCALAQAQAAAAPEPTWSQEDFMKIVTEVQKKLAGLSTFSVFDWLT